MPTFYNRRKAKHKPTKNNQKSHKRKGKPKWGLSILDDFLIKPTIAHPSPQSKISSIDGNPPPTETRVILLTPQEQQACNEDGSREREKVALVLCEGRTAIWICAVNAGRTQSRWAKYAGGS